MVALDSSCTERPSAPRRIKQVLEAAEACFQKHGFHATSMAQIAAAAQMSVGHIYRYFPSKDDIIAAILERDVSLAMDDFDAVEAQDDMYAAFLEHWRCKVMRMAARNKSAIWLEILAEAARNPRAAAVVAGARKSLAVRLRRLVQAAVPGRWTDAEVADKVDLLMLLCDAVAFKSCSTPEYCAERTADQFVDYARCIFSPDGSAAGLTGR